MDAAVVDLPESVRHEPGKRLAEFYAALTQQAPQAVRVQFQASLRALLREVGRRRIEPFFDRRHPMRPYPWLDEDLLGWAVCVP